MASQPAPNLSSWRCPECQRLIPRHVEVCRCGTERRRLEGLGIKLAAAPSPFVAPTARPIAYVDESSLAYKILGYRSDERVPGKWSIPLKALFLTAVIAVAVGMVKYVQRDPLPTRGNIRILMTLDDFTQDAGPTSPNTIPKFLALAGTVGALGPSSDPDEPVQHIDDAELKQGFCTQSISRQIRHQYPGYYDSWPDDKLERLALEKYPEMRNRTCVLPYQIEVTPAGIFKYALKPRTLVMSLGLWTAAVLVTGLAALACMNLYYRGLVDRLAV